MTALTADRPAPGLVVYQPARGFRYGAEVFWLVGFALEGGVPATAADLGAGSGVIAWLLAAQGVSVRGVDARAEWADCWARTAAESRAAGQVALEVGDVREAVVGPVDLVVCNPPFYPRGSGPDPSDPWRRAARVEGTATVQDFVRRGLESLAPGGRVVVVVPVAREPDVRASGGAVVRSAAVGRRRVLLELCREARGPERRVVVEEGGPEVAAWYARARGVGGAGAVG